MIREAGLPVADTINKLDDPKEGWLRLFSTRRANRIAIKLGSLFVIGLKSTGQEFSHCHSRMLLTTCSLE